MFCPRRGHTFVTSSKQVPHTFPSTLREGFIWGLKPKRSTKETQSHKHKTALSNAFFGRHSFFWATSTAGNALHPDAVGVPAGNDHATNEGKRGGQASKEKKQLRHARIRCTSERRGGAAEAFPNRETSRPRHSLPGKTGNCRCPVGLNPKRVRARPKPRIAPALPVR